MSTLKHSKLNFLHALPSAVQVNDVAFSSDENHFATCSEDGSVRVWSAPSNEMVVQFQVLNQVSHLRKGSARVYEEGTQSFT